MLVLVFLPIICTTSGANGMHPSGVTRTRIRVFGVNFSEFLIKGNEMWFKLEGN